MEPAGEEWDGGEEPVYRFFELFDWEMIPGARRMAEAAAAGRLEVTPPFKPHFEDKLWLALFWAPALAGIWQQALRGWCA